MSTDVVRQMATIADSLVAALSAEQRDAALLPFDGEVRTRWTYLPGTRPGVMLLELSGSARKAAHRLLASALSRHAFAQAVTIMALEEVLDLDENGVLGRHSADYRVVVFGRPGADAWAWRFEGHHLSITATITGPSIVVAPLFLGSNPARVDHRGRLVVGPLTPEEDLARALIADMDDGLRAQAVVAQIAPNDIRTKTAVAVPGELPPPGVPGASLGAGGRDLLDRLLRLYLERLTPALAGPELDRIDPAEVNFAWEGGLRAGEGHYYRLQAPHLLIEYDNTQRDANHIHTVLRRPGEDFGAAVLPAHRAAEVVEVAGPVAGQITWIRARSLLDGFSAHGSTVQAAVNDQGRCLVTVFQRYLAEEIAIDHVDGIIGRREALRRLSMLGFGLPAASALIAACGGGGEDASAPATSAPATSAAPQPATSQPAQGVATQPITFAGPEGRTLQGAWAAAATPKGAVLVIHENRGLNDHIRSVAGRFAAAGYSALAIDLLSAEGGTESLGGDAEATAALAKVPPERFSADMKAGVAELARRVPNAKIGAVGFCFGGGMTWLLVASDEPRLAAAAPFYGPLPDNADFGGSKAAVLGIYAEQDQRVNASRDAAESALEQAGLTHEIVTYPGVDHAFFNDTGARHNPDIAAQAYQKVLGWFDRYLSS